MGLQTIFQWATPVTVGWFEDRT